MFAGRKILVTGAASGIGRATVLFLADRDADIVGVDMSETGLSSLAEEMTSRNVHFTPVIANLMDENLEHIFASAVADGKKLDGLVHCAGISGIVPLASLSKDRLHKVLDVNFYSFVELVRHYSKKKYGGQGSVVGISSLAAELPRAYELAYITSKAALNAAIPCLAIELAGKGIRVNGIMPGVVNTGMISEHQSEEQKAFADAQIKKTLLGAAQPEDIAKAISFLLSDNSRMITGRVIPVDGGMFL